MLSKRNYLGPQGGLGPDLSSSGSPRGLLWGSLGSPRGLLGISLDESHFLENVSLAAARARFSHPGMPGCSPGAPWGATNRPKTLLEPPLGGLGCPWPPFWYLLGPLGTLLKSIWGPLWVPGKPRGVRRSVLNNAVSQNHARQCHFCSRFKTSF